MSAKNGITVDASKFQPVDIEYMHEALYEVVLAVNEYKAGEFQDELAFTATMCALSAEINATLKDIDARVLIQEAAE
jgi:hypothetical protein